MARDFHVVIERDAEGYVNGIRARATRVSYTSPSLDELMVRVREAIELWLEVEGKDVESLDFVGVQRITISGKKNGEISQFRSPSLTYL